MSGYFDPVLMLSTLVFLAVVLGIEGAFLYYRDAVLPKKRVSKRMQLIAGGASTEEILATLRRPTTEASSGLFASLTTYLETRLTQAGMRMPASRMLVMMAATTVLVGIVFPVLGGITGTLRSGGAILLIAMFAVAIGIGLPIFVLNMRATKRMKLFDAQFPIALDIFVRGLRAGYPVASALELLVAEVADPIASEFGLVVAEMQYGFSLRAALANLGERVRTQDVQMFVVSVAIQAETGGSLADILDGLSKVIRDRASMVLKVRALASEGKMTGMILSFLPVGTFCFTFASQPRFYLDVVDDSWFMPGIIIMLAVYASGIFIMRRMIAIKV